MQGMQIEIVSYLRIERPIITSLIGGDKAGTKKRSYSTTDMLLSETQLKGLSEYGKIDFPFSK